jgi:hypothetical protein
VMVTMRIGNGGERLEAGEGGRAREGKRNRSGQ